MPGLWNNASCLDRPALCDCCYSWNPSHYATDQAALHDLQKAYELQNALTTHPAMLTLERLAATYIDITLLRRTGGFRKPAL